MDRPHYGWYIAAVCMLMSFGASLLSTGMAVTLSSLRTEIGFSGSETSLVMTIICLSALVATFFSDKLYGFLGMRWGTSLAVLSGMVAFLIFSVAGDSLYVYYLGAAFGGITYGLGMSLPASILMRRWFNRNRAFALSLSSAGSGLGVAVGSPVLETIIETSGLKVSFYIEALYMLAVAILLFVVVRNDPGSKGLEPVGGKDWKSPVKSISKYSSAKVGTGIIAVVFIATTLIGFCGNPATSSLALNYNILGFDHVLVALGLSVFGFVLLFSKLSFGYVIDRMGTLFATVAFGAPVIIGLFGCYLAGMFSENTFMFCCMVLLGIGYPLTMLGYPNWANDFVSADEYPKTVRRLQMGYMIGSIVGSSIPGIIADTTGDYTLAFLMFSLVFLTAITLVASCYVYVDRHCIRSA